MPWGLPRMSRAAGRWATVALGASELGWTILYVYVSRTFSI